MCSIDEAWAGQTFAGKPVSSQSEIRKAYMAIPDNLFHQNNEFLPNTKVPPSREFTRGINSKFSREPRVPAMQRNSPEANFSISSVMPPRDNYGGVHPSSEFLKTNQGAIVPASALAKDSFSDINNAFTVSRTVDNFMARGMEDNELLQQDNDDDRMMVQYKYGGSRGGSGIRNNETDIEDADGHQINNNNMSETFADIDEIKNMLRTIMNKLEMLESQLHTNQSRNSYDIALYVVIGMLVAFVLSSMWKSMRRR